MAGIAATAEAATTGIAATARIVETTGTTVAVGMIAVAVIAANGATAATAAIAEIAATTTTGIAVVDHPGTISKPTAMGIATAEGTTAVAETGGETPDQPAAQVIRAAGTTTVVATTDRRATGAHSTTTEGTTSEAQAVTKGDMETNTRGKTNGTVGTEATAKSVDGATAAAPTAGTVTIPWPFGVTVKTKPTADLHSVEPTLIMNTLMRSLLP